MKRHQINETIMQNLYENTKWAYEKWSDVFSRRFCKNANGGSLPSLTVAYTTLPKFHLRPYMQILYAKHRENRIIKLNEAPHVPPSTKQNFSQGRED